MYKIFIIIIITILLYGCNRIKEGQVIEKWHEPESMDLVLLPMTIINGKSTIVIMTPHYIYDGEDFCIKVKGINKKGDEVIKKFYIEKESYDSLKVGQYICIDGDCLDDDPTYKKVRKNEKI